MYIFFSFFYITVMECLSRCHSTMAARQAEELFAELQDLSRDGDDPRFQPSTYTYATLIKAWAYSGARNAPLRAEELLEELLEGRYPNAPRPNALVFTAVLQSWARSHYKTKAVKALDLLKRLRALAAQNDDNDDRFSDSAMLMAYNTAIDACSRTRGSDEQQLAALKVAFAVHKAIRLDDRVAGEGNHVTFATLLRAVGFLMPHSERNDVARAVFAKARAAGQVDKSVLKALQGACDSAVYTELLQNDMTESLKKKGNFDFDTIPASWSKNVQN